MILPLHSINETMKDSHHKINWAIPFNIGTTPIEGSGYPMGEGGCIVKFSKGVTQRIFLKKAKIFVSKGGKMISKGG